MSTSRKQNVERANINWAQIASLQAGISEIVAAKIGSADIGYALNISSNAAILLKADKTVTGGLTLG